MAARRVRSALAAGAAVDVVAPETVEGFPDVPVAHRDFRDDDVLRAWLVLACTGIVDYAVAAACERQRTWCVRADDRLDGAGRVLDEHAGTGAQRRVGHPAHRRLELRAGRRRG